MIFIFGIGAVYEKSLAICDCLFIGKTFSMIGGDESVHSLGIIPCSIEWLFKLIEEKREKYLI